MTGAAPILIDLLLGLLLSGRGTWLLAPPPPPFLVGVLLLDAFGFFSSSSDSAVN